MGDELNRTEILQKASQAIAKARRIICMDSTLAKNNELNPGKEHGHMQLLTELFKMGQVSRTQEENFVKLPDSPFYFKYKENALMALRDNGNSLEMFGLEMERLHTPKYDRRLKKQ